MSITTPLQVRRCGRTGTSSPETEGKPTRGGGTLPHRLDPEWLILRLTGPDFPDEDQQSSEVRPLSIPSPNDAHWAVVQGPHDMMKGTAINGRPYETAVAVTPPGRFALEPTLPPPRPAPQAPSDDEDPYQLDVSDESSEDDRPAKKKKQPNSIDPQDNGYISDFWGMHYLNGSTMVERDNSLCFMYSNRVYYSKCSNALFVGQSATDASTFERNNYDAYCPPNSNQTYARAIRGIPNSIFKFNKLLTLILDKSDHFRYREAEEAFLLLRELYVS